ncbi:hypothetical protein [Cupriavidus sp.]|nr:hypothetical protein [Cupriavidus sp.]
MMRTLRPASAGWVADGRAMAAAGASATVCSTRRRMEDAGFLLGFDMRQ